jgi:peptidase A4-like protein
MRKLTAAACVSAVALLGAAVPVTAVTASAASPGRALCAKSYNPYEVAASSLRSCGDRLMTLSRVRSLPGGGKAYSYGTYTQLVPPAHFNVLKASDKQLAEYGILTRKDLGARQWYRLMSHVRSFAGSTPYLVRIPYVHAASTSPNWAGYDVNDHNYTQVSTEWVEPQFQGANCSGDAFVQWAGIGGIRTDDLGQTGTSFNVPGLAAHQGWIEANSGGTGSIVGVDFTASANDMIFADVLWDASTSEFQYTLEDLTTGHLATYTGHSRPVTADLQTAEVISERPVINNEYSELSDFSFIPVEDPMGYWASGDSSFYSDSHNAITMEESGNILANTFGSLASDNVFSVIWEGCG